MDNLNELIEYCDTFSIILDIQINGKEKSIEIPLRTRYKLEVTDVLDAFRKVIADKANGGGMFK